MFENFNAPQFPDREEITAQYNEWLNLEIFPDVTELPQHIEEKLTNYPEVASMVKKFYLYPFFPEKYIVYSFDIFFNEKLVYKWTLGASLEIKENIIPFPELIRINLLDQLGCLIYRGEVIFDRISNIEINSVISALNAWYENEGRFMDLY